MSDSSESIPLDVLGEASSEGSVAAGRFHDAEAEECEETPDTQESDSNGELAPFVAPALDSYPEEVLSSVEMEDDEDAAPTPGNAEDDAPEPQEVHPQCNKSFRSETGDDGFAAFADEFSMPSLENTPHLTATPAPTTLSDPHLPSDPNTINAERTALEGPGTTQIHLELRPMEVTGAKLLKTNTNHVYATFLRGVLEAHNAPHIRFCLTKEVDGKQRGQYLFDRIRRRHWARIKGSSVADLCNDQLPHVTGEVTVQLDLEPSEVTLAGVAVPTAQSKIIGERATGMVVSQGSVKNAVGLADVLPHEGLVIIAATVDVIYTTRIATGTYGTYTASVSVKADMVPAREGGVLTGVVTSMERPRHQLNRSVANPSTKGAVVLAIAPKREVKVYFTAEVPTRSLSLGRPWVVRLVRNKDRKFELEFALDPFVHAVSGDTEDEVRLSARQVSDLNNNRRPISTPQHAKHWAACTDAHTGYRAFKVLPETGFWTPKHLGDLFGSHMIRGTEVTVGEKKFHSEDVNYAAVSVSDHVIGKSVSQRARVAVRIDKAEVECMLYTPYAHEQVKNSQLLCLKVCDCV